MTDLSLEQCLKNPQIDLSFCGFLVYEYGKQRNINICNEAVWLNITEVTKFIDILEKQYCFYS